jgi:hypothetical protein
MIMSSDSKHDDRQHNPQRHVLEHLRPDDSQPEASLFNLPVEILEMIATDLDNDELRSMRATCRALCNGSTNEFDRRHTSSEVQILVTRDTLNMRKLTVLLRSPYLVKAQAAMARLLVLHDPLYVDKRHPGKTLASNTVTSYPDVWTFLQQKNYRQNHGHALAPLIFERVADLPPQTTNLSCLVIEGADLDGDALIDMLKTHKHSLRNLALRKIILTKFIDCMRALCRTETRRLEAEELMVRDKLGYEEYFTQDHAAFPRFKRTMRSKWELRSGLRRSQLDSDPNWKRFTFVIERKKDIE